VEIVIWFGILKDYNAWA